MGRNGFTRAMDPSERFWPRVERQENGCWLWTGALRGHRYAVFMVDGTSIMVHRWVYETFVGPIPPNMQIDHICAVTRCVNPEHLRPLLAQQNVHAYWREQRGVCRNGHEMTDDNTVWRLRGTQRRCRTCERARMARWRAKRT